VPTDLSQVIDACVLINLVATDELPSILAVVKKPSLICSVVKAESIYLKTADPLYPKELIDLNEFVDVGALSICQIENEKEELLYVDLASMLDDGEAMTLAIAIARGFDLATDERKAGRFFLAEVVDQKRLISTSVLLRQWADAKRLSAQKLKVALQKIETRASYRPPTDDRNYEWWMNSSR
jgi:predicted nucleic acid-binding protein